MTKSFPSLSLSRRIFKDSLNLEPSHKENSLIFIGKIFLTEFAPRLEPESMALQLSQLNFDGLTYDDDELQNALLVRLSHLISCGLD